MKSPLSPASLMTSRDQLDRQLFEIESGRRPAINASEAAELRDAIQRLNAVLVAGARNKNQR